MRRFQHSHAQLGKEAVQLGQMPVSVPQPLPMLLCKEPIDLRRNVQAGMRQAGDYRNSLSLRSVEYADFHFYLLTLCQTPFRKSIHVLMRIDETRKERLKYRLDWGSFFENECDCKYVYVKVARRSVRYGERERPGRRSVRLLSSIQVAHAPRTVLIVFPYTHLQYALKNDPHSRRLGLNEINSDACRPGPPKGGTLNALSSLLQAPADG
jgi:hypothetical protein